MEYLGKLLSCFVTERKHRTTKRCALFVFRHIENTVINDMLNRQCEDIGGGACESLFTRTFLIKPKVMNISGVQFHHAKLAVLPCGTVRHGDVVWTRSMDVGSVVCFWSAPAHGAQFSVQLRVYTCSNDNRTQWATTDPHVRAVDSDDIVDALAWTPLREGLIRVIPPVRSLV